MRVTRHPLAPSILILPPPSVAPTMNQAMKIPTSAPKGTLIRARPEQATQIRTVAKIACLGKSANGERIQHLDFVKLRLEPNWCVIYYCEINRFEWNWPRNFCTGLRLCRWGHQHYFEYSTEPTIQWLWCNIWEMQAISSFVWQGSSLMYPSCILIWNNLIVVLKFEYSIKSKLQEVIAVGSRHACLSFLDEKVQCLRLNVDFFSSFLSVPDINFFEFIWG